MVDEYRILALKLRAAEEAMAAHDKSRAKLIMEIHVLREICDRVLAEQTEKVEDLKMVCRRLATAKTLENRDAIVEQCSPLFVGSILR